MAHDWAFLDPQEYFDFHVEMGNIAMFCRAYTFGDYAFYPTELGPTAPGPGRDFLPRLYELAQKAGMPFWSYLCSGTDLNVANKRWDWLIPTSREQNSGAGFLAPESGWTDLLCARIAELVKEFPVDWIVFDWFTYGGCSPGFAVQPASFVEENFKSIMGREMPNTGAEITEDESLDYTR